MGLAESAKKYIDENRNVKCRICGKDVYTYQDIECTKRGRKYVIVHKECVVKKNK